MMMALLYLDPASGSIAFQVAIGSIVTVLAAIRLWWTGLKRLFGYSDREK